MANVVTIDSLGLSYVLSDQARTQIRIISDSLGAYRPEKYLAELMHAIRWDMMDYNVVTRDNWLRLCTYLGLRRNSTPEDIVRVYGFAHFDLSGTPRSRIRRTA